jgi:hypothetical protein
MPQILQRVAFCGRLGSASRADFHRTGRLACDRAWPACPERSRNRVRVIPPSHHGSFAASNRLWFMQRTPTHVSDGALVVAADRVCVRWTHDGTDVLAVDLIGARAV